MGHTGPAAASPPGSSTRSCPTYGRFQHLKPGKSPGLDSILPEFILHEFILHWSALKSWFCDFLTSCVRQLKIPKIWRRALAVAIPKPENPLGDPKSYRPITLLCVPFKIRERLIYARVELIIDPLLSQEQAGFRHGRLAVDQVTLWHRKSRIAFQLKRKPELCLLISQQHTTLYGTAASPASCCDCWLIDTGSIWSWIWLAITALHLPPEMAKGAGYDASRTASHKDLS